MATDGVVTCRCGQVLPLGAHFCANCGNPVSTPIETTPVSPVSGDSFPPPQGTPYGAPPSYAPPSPAAPAAQAAQSSLPVPGVAPWAQPLPDYENMPKKPVDQWAAWLIAVIPLLAIAIAIGFSSGNPAVAYYSGAIALVLNIVVSIWDSRRVEKAGYGDLLGWAIFLIPVYLFKRQARVRQTMAVPFTWIVTFCIALAVQAMLPRIVGVPLDMAKVESNITTTIQDRLKTAGISGTVTTDCPASVAARPGESFNCIVNASDGTTASVKVTVEDAAGDITWVVTN